MDNFFNVKGAHWTTDLIPWIVVTVEYSTTAFFRTSISSFSFVMESSPFPILMPIILNNVVD